MNRNVLIESTSVDELLERLRVVLNEIDGLKQPCKENEELWSRQETADYFQVSFQTLHNWKKNKILLPIVVGTRVYYKKADIDALLNKKGGNYEV
jgi:hypothetical protein